MHPAQVARHPAPAFEIGANDGKLCLAVRRIERRARGRAELAGDAQALRFLELRDRIGQGAVVLRVVLGRHAQPLAQKRHARIAGRLQDAAAPIDGDAQDRALGDLLRARLAGRLLAQLLIFGAQRAIGLVRRVEAVERERKIVGGRHLIEHARGVIRGLVVDVVGHPRPMHPAIQGVAGIGQKRGRDRQFGLGLLHAGQAGQLRQAIIGGIEPIGIDARQMGRDGARTVAGLVGPQWHKAALFVEGRDSGPVGLARDEPFELGAIGQKRAKRLRNRRAGGGNKVRRRRIRTAVGHNGSGRLHNGGPLLDRLNGGLRIGRARPRRWGG